MRLRLSRCAMEPIARRPADSGEVYLHYARILRMSAKVRQQRLLAFDRLWKRSCAESSRCRRASFGQAARVSVPNAA